MEARPLPRVAADNDAPESRRLNVGLGRGVLPGQINLGIESLHQGVSFKNSRALLGRSPRNPSELIELIHTRVHLPDTVGAMNELFRITQPKGRVLIRVPFWNSSYAVSDPTHMRFVNEETFDFFDSSSRHGQERAYYSTARFAIRRVYLYTWFLSGLPHVRVGWAPLRFFLSCLARFLGGVISAVEVKLEALK